MLTGGYSRRHPGRQVPREAGGLAQARLSQPHDPAGEPSGRRLCGRRGLGSRQRQPAARARRGGPHRLSGAVRLASISSCQAPRRVDNPATIPRRSIGRLVVLPAARLARAFDIADRRAEATRASDTVRYGVHVPRESAVPGISASAA
jgi:hypothetical protein